MAIQPISQGAHSAHSLERTSEEVTLSRTISPHDDIVPCRKRLNLRLITVYSARKSYWSKICRGTSANYAQDLKPWMVRVLIYILAPYFQELGDCFVFPYIVAVFVLPLI